MTPGRGALAAMPMAKRLRLMRSQWQWYLLIAPAIVYLLIFSSVFNIGLDVFMA